MTWYATKEVIETVTGLDMDALHVHAGVLVHIAAALILRRPLSSPWPWLAVLGVTLFNEWSDLTLEIWPNRVVQYGESLRDIWNTMLLPTLLLLLVRHVPTLFADPRGNLERGGSAA